MLFLLFGICALRAQWIPTKGPFVEYVDDIVLIDSSIFSSIKNDLYFSNDDGESWKILTLPTADHIYSLGSTGGWVFIFCSHSMYISKDIGKNWNRIVYDGVRIPLWNVWSATVCDSHLFVQDAGQGIFISPDNGINWMISNDGLPSAWPRFVSSIETNVYAGFDNGLFLYDWQKNRWNRLAYRGGQVPPIKIKNYLFAADLGGVYRSSNNGDNWETVFSVQSGGNVVCTAAAETLLFIGTYGNGVYFSSNYGKSWNAANRNYEVGVKRLGIHGKCVFAATNYNGLIRTDDNGNNWLPINISSINVKALSFATSDSNLFVVSPQYGVFQMIQNQGWRTFNSGLNVGGSDFFYASSVKGSNIYLCSSSSLWKANINDCNWIQSAKGLTGGENRNIFIDNENIYICAGSDIFRSIDNALTWKNITEGRAGQGLASVVVDGNTLYVINNNGLTISRDGGYIWSSNTSVPPRPSVVYVNGSTLYLGSWDSGVYLSNTEGRTWVPANSGIFTRAVTCFAGNDSILFIGTDKGVYMSIDNGSSWQDQSQGLNSYIHCLTLQGLHLFAGTDDGVWFRPISEMMTDVNLKHNIEQPHWVLKQNYPNPFNPTTKIDYTIYQKSRVTLKVFNRKGQEVATLVSQELLPGEYSSKWHTNNQPNGIYFYQLLVDGKVVATKKLTLIK
jgi:photosystem II stability/assembly factor-like uncharacterized protein